MFYSELLPLLKECKNNQDLQKIQHNVDEWKELHWLDHFNRELSKLSCSEDSMELEMEFVDQEDEIRKELKRLGN